jgi:hypothetical protein
MPIRILDWHNLMSGNSSAFIGAGRTLYRRYPRNQVAPLWRSAMRLRRQSRLARDAILVWADLGNGAFKNLAPGYECRQGFPGTFVILPSIGSSFGGASKWPGTYVGGVGGGNSFINPGYAATSEDSHADLTMFTATNLQVLPANAGNTFACSYVKTGSMANDWGWLWGRTGVSAGEPPADPFAYWAFVEGYKNGFPDPDGTVSCFVNSNGGILKIGTVVASALNTFNTFVCSTINTGAGTGTSSFYHNDTLIATVTGVQMTNPNPSTVAETMPQIGGLYHWGTGESVEAINGFVPLGIFTGSPWSADDAAYFYKHPGDMIERA